MPQVPPAGVNSFRHGVRQAHAGDRIWRLPSQADGRWREQSRADFAGRHRNDPAEVVELECDFDRLPVGDILEAFLVEVDQQVAAGVTDERGDRANPIVARDHAGPHLEVDDAAVLGRDQRGVVEVVPRLRQLSLHRGHRGVHAVDL